MVFAQKNRAIKNGFCTKNRAIKDEAIEKKNMTNALKLIRDLDDFAPLSARIQPLKSRRQRRREERDRIKSDKLNQK
jgi:hypothetical protein